MTGRLNRCTPTRTVCFTHHTRKIFTSTRTYRQTASSALQRQQPSSGDVCSHNRQARAHGRLAWHAQTSAACSIYTHTLQFGCRKCHFSDPATPFWPRPYCISSRQHLLITSTIDGPVCVSQNAHSKWCVLIIHPVWLQKSHLPNAAHPAALSLHCSSSHQHLLYIHTTHRQESHILSHHSHGVLLVR